MKLFDLKSYYQLIFVSIIFIPFTQIFASEEPLPNAPLCNCIVCNQCESTNELELELNNIKNEIKLINNEYKTKHQISQDIKDKINNLEEKIESINTKIINTALAGFKTVTEIRNYQLEIIFLILTISGIAIAILGTLAYKLLYIKITKKLDDEMDVKQSEINKQLDVERHSVLARMYTNLSYIMWTDYSGLKFENGEEKTGYLKFLSMAITFSEDAHSHVEKLLELEEKENIELIVHCYNNQAYHLSMRHLKEKIHSYDGKKAIPLSKYVYDEVSGNEEIYPKWYLFFETCAFVFLIFGNDIEKREGEKIIKNLFNDETIDKSWRTEIAQNYQSNFNMDIKT